MRFRLTYEGPLYSTQRDPERGQPNRLAEHKHAIRRVFHGQLKQLWSENRFLREHRVFPRDVLKSDTPANMVGMWAHSPDEMTPLVEVLADMNPALGYRWLPLVRPEWHLLCSLDVLFLRRDPPGSVLSAGDIDNRIKTLIDALRPPQGRNELVGSDLTPRDGEDPFFCLLQDDKQVTHFIVETDTLLDPRTSDDADTARVRLIITVELKPYFVTMFNVAFA